MTLAERLAFHPSGRLGDLVQNGLDLELPLAMAFEEVVANVAGWGTNAAELADKAHVGLGRKVFVAEASVAIHIGRLRDIEDVELGEDLTLRHEESRTLLAVFGLASLEEKDKAVLVAGASATDNAIGQSILGVTELGNDRNLDPGKGIRRSNGVFRDKGIGIHDAVRAIKSVGAKKKEWHSENADTTIEHHTERIQHPHQASSLQLKEEYKSFGK